MGCSADTHLSERIEYLSEGIAQLNFALEYSPGDKNLPVTRAVAEWEVGHSVEAAESLKLAVKSDPQHHPLGGTLTDALREQIRIDEAEQSGYVARSRIFNEMEVRHVSPINGSAALVGPLARSRK